MTPPPIISADSLTRSFRGPGGSSVVAVRDLTMEVQEGSLTAFLGPNGAGKSTSLRMLTTLLEPSGGSARVCGYDVVAQAPQVRARIGYIGQRNGAGQYQRVRDELLAQGALHGLRRREAVARADELLDALRLTEVADRPTMKLSGGQRRRVDIALGLVPRPRLLFLDEPSTGLDPQSRAHLWQHLADLRARYGTTLFLTTHYLDEADQYAERVLVVDHGRIIADDSADQLKATLAGDRLALTVGGDADAVRGVLRRAAERSGATEARVDAAPAPGGTRLTVSVNQGDRVLPAVLRELHDAGHDVVAADLARPTLDDVFLNLTGRSLREESNATSDSATSDSATSGSATSGSATSGSVTSDSATSGSAPEPTTVGAVR